MMPHPLADAAVSDRRRIVVERIPAIGPRRRFAVLLIATGLGYAALFVCAAVPSAIGVVAAAAAVTVVEWVAVRHARFQDWGLVQVGLAGPARGLLRGLALLLFAARAASTSLTLTTAAAVAVLAAARAAHQGALQVVQLFRTSPLAARNLRLALPTPPAAPPRWVTRPERWTAGLELVLAVGLAGAAYGADAVGVVAPAGAVLAGCLGPVLLIRQIFQLHRMRIRDRVDSAVRAAIAELGPEVVVYLGNGAEWRYQLEMWLATLETVRRPVLLIVRDHEVLQTLAPTTLPTVSVTRGGTLMELELPSVRTALYVGNAANNVHFLRRPGLRNVFIGHGDSDKSASSNPVTRVYHEVWVAGPAGRDRYAAAGVEIPESAFVEVGRPQLGELRRRVDQDPRPAVLYAPTFEGWGDDPFHTSLPHVGPALVRALLSRGDVRVMYRPHPRTGHRDSATRHAHLEILRLLRAAGAVAGAAVGLPAPPTPPRPRRGDLLDELARPAATWSRTEHDAAVDQWNAMYWAAHPGHRILLPPAPDLHACFTVADALIADISSVPNDFLAADRPYAIVNSAGVTDAAFRAQSATARGGFVLDRELTGLGDLVAAAGGGIDPTAQSRAEIRRYLLGPRGADPVARFRAELDRICATPPAQPRPESGLAAELLDPLG